MEGDGEHFIGVAAQHRHSPLSICQQANSVVPGRTRRERRLSGLKAALKMACSWPPNRRSLGVRASSKRTVFLIRSQDGQPTAVGL